MPIIKAIKVINNDSPKNWSIRATFSAPKTFLTPTSEDLFDDRAVDKFMKLIQAINKMNAAMEANTYKYVLLAGGVTFEVTTSLKWISLTGMRNCFLSLPMRFKSSPPYF